MRSDRIRRRRLELGLARRDVAREVGLSEGAVTRVEHGSDADEWSVRHVRRLARVLGTTVSELLDPEPRASKAEADDDVTRLAAVLAHCDRLTPVRALSETVGWTLGRTNDVLDELDERSKLVGLRIQRLRGQVALRPRPCESDLGALTRLEMTTAGISRTQARTLHAVSSGTFTEQRADAQDRMALSSLVGAGLVDDHSDGPRLSDAVAFSLLAMSPTTDHENGAR